ncbi:MAG: hypothetical protein KIT69_03860 [Propionibacteriaceae bacterium]|nr:hypothetical protein [Propionibacteriaceae bacterium]
MAGRDWTPQERAEARRNTVEQLHTQLTEQVSKLDSLEAWQRWLGLVRSLHSYSFSNTLLIAAQRPDATMVAGFSTWKQRGHSVRKGEKAIKILAPILQKVPMLDDAGRPVVDENGEPRFRRQMVGVKPVNVFDAGQVTPPVEGPPRPQLLTGEAPAGLWESLSELALIEGYTVTRGDCGAANGHIDFEAHRIRIRADVDELMACKSLCHEVAHALTMTPDDVETYTAQRELREVEAESVAYTVLGAHGVDSSQYTFDYVAGWAARAATDTTSIADIITATGQRVIAAADRILAHTQPRTSIEDELADQWTQAVQPSPVIAAETMPWETVAEAPSDAVGDAQKALPQAPHSVSAVSR